MATLEELQTKTQEKMDKALQALRNELTNIRTGRATPSLLDQVKVVNKKGEASRVEIRNIRRDFNDAVKKQVKAKEITEDDAKDATDFSQKLTDKYTKKIDDVLAQKEKEVMAV